MFNWVELGVVRSFLGYCLVSMYLSFLGPQVTTYYFLRLVKVSVRIEDEESIGAEFDIDRSCCSGGFFFEFFHF